MSPTPHHTTPGKDGIPAIKDIVFVGLITLMDPPRDEVPQAVRECHAAGVKVVMVTGDHPATAEAICKKIGLITTKTQKDVARQRKVCVSCGVCVCVCVCV